MQERLAPVRPANPVMRPIGRRTRKPHAAFAVFGALCALLLLPSHLRSQAADPNPLRIQVLNGRTGRPVTNARILLWRSVKLDTLTPGNDPLTTDGEGYTAIPVSDATTLVAHVDQHMLCSREVHSFSLMDVRVRGVVSENICSKRIKLFPQPGTLILFVRDETFFERMRR